MSSIQKGLSVVAKNSIFEPTTIVADDTLALKASDISMSQQADGGYWSASITFNADEAEVGDWVINGVGRDITFYNEAGVEIWNGIANIVSAEWGGISLTSGTFLELANQVTVSYQEVTYNTNPPTGGTKGTVADAVNGASQAVNGIQAEAVNAGTGEAVDAEQYRDRFISERAWPLTSVSFSLQKGNLPSVTIDCIGYVQLLKRPLYSSSTAGRQNASEKVAAIFGQDPNGIFPDTSNIDENTYQTSYAESGNKRLFEVLRSVTSLGDSSQNRWISGVGANRKPYYRQVLNEVSYTYTLADEEPRIEGKNRSYVFPWNVQAGKWMFVNGLLENIPYISSYERDPQYIFIESVSWSSVWGLEINGGRVFKSAQILAQMGISGSF